MVGCPVSGRDIPVNERSWQPLQLHRSLYSVLHYLLLLFIYYYYVTFMNIALLFNRGSKHAVSCFLKW